MNNEINRKKIKMKFNWKKVSSCLLLIFPLSASASFEFKNKTIYLSVLEGIEHNQQHYTLGIAVNRRKGVGYLDVGILNDDDSSTDFKRSFTFGLGYNWHIYNIGKHNFSLGLGALVTHKGRCNSNSLNRDEREYCKDGNQGTSYGDSDLLLYPEVRVTFNITKGFDIALNAKKFFSVNDSFDVENLFIGTTFLIKF
jgi:hypothetical protein